MSAAPPDQSPLPPAAGDAVGAAPSARWLDATIVLCGVLTVVGAGTWLALAILKTVSASQSVALSWSGGSSAVGAAVAAETGDWEVEQPTSGGDPALAAVTAAVQQRSGRWDRAELDMLSGNRPQGRSRETDGEIPRSRRWQIYFPEGLTVTEYAAQLDTFGIELGMLAGDGQIEYVTALSLAAPTRSQGAVADEQRLYLTWTRGDLQAADQELLGKAGLESKDKIVLQFYPETLEQELADLEESYKGRPAANIYRTVFGIRPRLSTYEFYVREQTARE